MPDRVLHAPPGADHLHLLAFLLTNVDLILAPLPVAVVAAKPLPDLHATRPHLDYEPRWDRLPSGRIELDTIRIDYPPVARA
jgi:hypothetical protein